MEDLPIGFGMALAQVPEAMQTFSRLSAAQQHSMIVRAHSVNSRREMHALVRSLTHTGGLL